MNAYPRAAVKPNLNGCGLDFREIAMEALKQARTLLERWLPGGAWQRNEYVVRNPTRLDSSPGSFKINAGTGVWSDFATGASGGDLIALRALIDNIPPIEAARAIAGELALNTGAGCTLEAYAVAKCLPLAFLRALGLETVTNPYRSGQAVFIPYRDREGKLIRGRLRVALSGKKKLVWDRLKERETALYGLDRLPDSGKLVLLVEGESDAQTLWHRGHGTLGVPGATNFKPKRDDDAFEGLEIVALIEPDAGGEALIARLSKSKHAARIKIARLDGFKDVSELHITAPDRFEEVLAKAVADAKPLISLKPKAASNAKASHPDLGNFEGYKPSQADQLITLAKDLAVFFNTPDRNAFAIVKADGHRETWPLRREGFKDWLLYRYLLSSDRAPNSESLGHALNTLRAFARFEGETIPVFTRIASHDGRLYLDLCDEKWRAIEITAAGWRVVNDPPVRFVRTKGMLPLPEPSRGGNIEELRPFINVASEDDLKLIVAWLLASLRPPGPYPLLAFCGEAGSAKSTAANVLRSLFDPNVAPLRSAPRNEQELFISASNSACLIFDNLSLIPVWLSDALCRIVTGGGYATRTLYTDSEETLFDVMRPIILTSVGEVVARSDLAARAVIVTLASISESRRMTDDAFNSMFQAARPRILGALLEALVIGLRDLPLVQMDRLPRMANFIKWTRACETGLWEPGGIQAAFDRNMAESVDRVIEGDSIAVALMTLLEKKGGRWRGSCRELFAELNKWAPRGSQHERDWPRSLQALTSRLTLASSSLRMKGITIERGRSHGARYIQIIAAASRVLMLAA
jgi:hypothetical protein